MKRAWCSAALVAVPLAAWSAGGHHSVDDANILDAGDCEAESWFTYASRDDRLLHGGGQCGVAGVELAIAAEPGRLAGESSRAWQAQLKWAREWTDRVHAGFSITPQWDARMRPRYVGTTISTLLTLQPLERWQLHVNAGRDFLNGAPNQARSGVALDWTAPDQHWLVALERYVENRTDFARAGMRWFASDDWTFDFSRAQHLRGPRPSNWTLAVTRSFKNSF